MAKNKTKVKPAGSINELMANIRKKYGDGAVTTANSNPIANVEAVSTGSLSLDVALGVGGIPVGRILELYGPESSGKTTLSLSLIKHAQLNGGQVAFIDVEHALDPQWAKAIGVDMDNMLISQPDSGEQAFDIMMQMITSGQINLIVVDSVAALIPQAEIDAEPGDNVIGAQARLMSTNVKKIANLANKYKCAVVFINQIREKIGVLFGSPETTPGGRALKFYASVRMDIRKSGKINVDGVQVGNKVKVKVVKNKVGRPFTEAIFDLYFGYDGYPSGIDYPSSVLNMAVEYDIVEQKGSWFNYGDLRIGLGATAARDFLASNEDLTKEIKNKVIDKLNINKNNDIKVIGNTDEDSEDSDSDNVEDVDDLLDDLGD